MDSDEYLPSACGSGSDASNDEQLSDDDSIIRKSKRSRVKKKRQSPKQKTKSIILDSSDSDDNGAEENKENTSSLASLSASARRRKRSSESTRRRKRSSAGSKASKASAKSEGSGKAKATRKRNRQSAEMETTITIHSTAHFNEDNPETDASVIETKPPKTKRRSLQSSATSKAKASPKSKKAKRRKSSESKASKSKASMSKAAKSGSDESDESRIEAWMRKANRPFDAKRVKENMELSISVDKTKKALAALSDSGSLVQKKFGKVLIYWTPQTKPADDGADSGKRLALARLTKDSTQLTAEKSRLQAELKLLTSAPSDASLESEVNKLATEIADKSVVFEQKSGAKDSVTEEERSEALLELHKYMRAWKRRKAAAAAMIEAIFPEAKARDVIRKRLGHETDESAKADMRSLDTYWKAARIQSRKIQDAKIQAKRGKKMTGIRRTKLKK